MPKTFPFYAQTNGQARYEWCEMGLRLLTPQAEAVVIVEVLSFTTCVDVALSRGATGWPCSWEDERAQSSYCLRPMEQL